MTFLSTKKDHSHSDKNTDKDGSNKDALFATQIHRAVFSEAYDVSVTQRAHNLELALKLNLMLSLFFNRINNRIRGSSSS